MFPGQTTLANPVACGYVNPRHRGLLSGPPPIPVVRIPVSGTNFNSLYYFDYTFDAPTLPPGSDFDAVFVVGESQPTNVQDLTCIRILNTDDPAAELFGDTTITTSPTWADATFTSSTTAASLAANAGTFPGIDTVIHFRNVPSITNIAIRIFGND